MSQKTIVVLGGTGKTGRRVAERLRARGVPFRLGSRGGEPPFDWENRAGWVLLSGRGEAEAQRCEQIVRESGAEWTLLRASWFCQNFSESFLLEPLLEGTLALPAGDVGEPFVDADDIADVAVAALTEERHAGQLYELTGRRLWTFAEATAEIARATQRDIRYVQISADEYAAALAGAGVPADVVAVLRYLFVEVLDGRNAHVADGVTRALGRPARDFSDYVRDAAAAGAWRGRK